MGVDPEIACEIVRKIGQLWLDGQFIDLQIHVEDILFSCNRLILCAYSKFFKVLLKSQVKGEHPIRQVAIRGISPEIFQLVLKAMYQGENGLSTENMIEFWHAVHQLEIPFLVSKCETFIDSHMTPENFVNIYQNALLLKSINMVKVGQQFVAKNLECFKELDILLQQPASYIEEIIGDDSLVGQSQNHVVEFILKWVNYELCASEAVRVCADSTVEDLSAQISEVTRNKHDSVEVIFQKPHATFNEDCKRSLSGQSLVRKQLLGKLLKQVRFANISQDRLEMLADNDLVMGSKETRDIVRQAMGLVFTSISVTSKDIEDTVVFVISGHDNDICAYSIDREDIFLFKRHACKIVYMHTYENKLLYNTLMKSFKKYPWLNMIEFPFQKEECALGYVENFCSVIVGDFLYEFKKNNYLCRRHLQNVDPYCWNKLFALPGHMSSPSLATLKDNVLCYNSTLNQEGKQEVYCFNTTSGKHWCMLTCDYEDCDFVTFTHNNSLYILYGNGVVVDVTNFVFFFLSFSLPRYSEIPESCLLWDFQFQISGAVVHQDNLIVFGDFTSVSVSEILECKIPGLKTIKFVHLEGLVTKCHPLAIPKKLLISCTSPSGCST